MPDFEDFYRASSARVLGHLYVMTGNRAEAEDAVAEAYARAWQRWSTVSQADSPEAWVRRVASRIAISGWRKAVTRLRAHHRDTTDLVLEGLSPDHVALMTALRGISAVLRRDIVLHYLAGLSVAEIAAETGTPSGTVKARLSRGRKALAALLDDAGFDEGRVTRARA
ncbi:sigma-70 family RNA polymerase sigma factor [Symbioplanes lichenis]|uniref:sigma-70 family RNA polymerase sigma factor n=1 Tax=Symbioplanes lichenis TaxID=1629072 RepID=UPI0027382600|nr:sigma-70 family RNA polymerase sigma factor [Actinoplanes lichenis]